jgi:hypothetical protein
MVEKLDSVIDTDFVLTVQLDGYILHPDRWSDDFLNFDYVGAPWPWHGVCGNGGFSLRSKKFIHTASKLHYQPYHPEYSSCPEDFYMCIMAKNHFTYNKCLISDNETGIRFSFEHPIPELEQYTIKTSFGFHGKHNLNDKTIHRRNV